MKLCDQPRNEFHNDSQPSSDPWPLHSVVRYQQTLRKYLPLHYKTASHAWLASMPTASSSSMTKRRPEKQRDCVGMKLCSPCPLQVSSAMLMVFSPRRICQENWVYDCWEALAEEIAFFLFQWLCSSLAPRIDTQHERYYFIILKYPWQSGDFSLSLNRFRCFWPWHDGAFFLPNLIKMNTRAFFYCTATKGPTWSRLNPIKAAYPTPTEVANEPTKKGMNRLPISLDL